MNKLEKEKDVENNVDLQKNETVISIFQLEKSTWKK